jgi:hypothetical protein
MLDQSVKKHKNMKVSKIGHWIAVALMVVSLFGCAMKHMHWSPHSAAMAHKEKFLKINPSRVRLHLHCDNRGWWKVKDISLLIETKLTELGYDVKTCGASKGERPSNEYCYVRIANILVRSGIGISFRENIWVDSPEKTEINKPDIVLVVRLEDLTERGERVTEEKYRVRAWAQAYIFEPENDKECLWYMGYWASPQKHEDTNNKDATRGEYKGECLMETWHEAQMRCVKRLCDSLPEALRINAHGAYPECGWLRQ